MQDYEVPMMEVIVLPANDVITDSTPLPTGGGSNLPGLG